MSNAIKVGDIVTLKSGGPDMTVMSVSQTLANCARALPDGRIKTESFPLATLKVKEDGDEAIS